MRCMEKKNLDKETKVALSDGEKIAHLVSSDGWLIAKRKLQARLLDIGNIMTVGKDTSKDMIYQELGARQMALEAILDWLYDVEGEGERFKDLNEQDRRVAQMREVMETSHILRLGDSGEELT